MEENIHRPKWDFPKSKEEIFRELIQDARRYWPELPDTQERMDPVLRMLFGAFAYQFETLHVSLQKIKEDIFEALARHLYYDALRFPTPAVTLLKFFPTDAGIEVDELTSLIYTEERGRERRTYHFTPVARLRLARAIPFKLLLLTKDGISDLSQRILEKGILTGNPEIFPLPREFLERWEKDRIVLFIGFKTEELTKAFTHLNLYVDAPQRTLSLLRWGTWFSSNEEGIFPIEGGEVPGKATFEITWKTKIPPLIPHHRGVKEFLSDFEDQFFPIKNLTPSPLPREIQDLLKERVSDNIGTTEGMAWIKIILPEETTEKSLLEIRGIHTNCIPAINLWHQVHNHLTQGLPLVEITLPDPLSKIYQIEEVRDSSGKVYENRLMASDLRSTYLYTIKEDGDRPCIVLHFEGEERVPDRIQITYSVTEDEDANGIEPGLITELYDKRQHPGIESVTNITRSSGGRKAPAREDLLRDFTFLLRNRSRAITSKDLEDLALSFDPRILRVNCEPGVETSPHGARRCIHVKISLGETEFATQGERDLFVKRLQTFLKERSPVNTSIRIIVES